MHAGVPCSSQATGNLVDKHRARDTSSAYFPGLLSANADVIANDDHFDAESIGLGLFDREAKVEDISLWCRSTQYISYPPAPPLPSRTESRWLHPATHSVVHDHDQDSIGAIDSVGEGPTNLFGSGTREDGAGHSSAQ